MINEPDVARYKIMLDSNIDNPERIVELFKNDVKRYAVVLLINKSYQKYEEWIKYCNSLDIRKIDPLFSTIFKGEKFPVSFSNYIMSYTNGEKFRREYEMSDYFMTEFRILLGGANSKIEHIDKQVQTGFGRCDLAIWEPKRTFVELKITKIKPKDIYQCIEYKKSNDPVIVICAGIDDAALSLAKTSDVGVYKYSIAKPAPTLIKLEYISGPNSPSLDEIALDPHYQFFGEEDAIARSLGWPGKIKVMP